MNLPARFNKTKRGNMPNRILAKNERKGKEGLDELERSETIETC